ncbi:hypothetical protein MOQ_006631 [Trypanosoma cruzi marinkellei]|uniref:Uncharacterized protein n=1 Tax=Trypanosoma cruzi marinkellei TaxID=85056 RepID=K2MR97_TRYCR|nr:hypothetical protein MOQ_006631 [Trypanosoma cruzi marinkellei]
MKNIIRAAVSFFLLLFFCFCFVLPVFHLKFLLGFHSMSLLIVLIALIFLLAAIFIEMLLRFPLDFLNSSMCSVFPFPFFFFFFFFFRSDCVCFWYYDNTILVVDAIFLFMHPTPPQRLCAVFSTFFPDHNPHYMLFRVVKIPATGSKLVETFIFFCCLFCFFCFHFGTFIDIGQHHAEETCSPSSSSLLFKERPHTRTTATMSCRLFSPTSSAQRPTCTYTRASMRRNHPRIRFSRHARHLLFFFFSSFLLSACDGVAAVVRVSV